MAHSRQMLPSPAT